MTLHYENLKQCYLQALIEAIAIMIILWFFQLYLCSLWSFPCISRIA